MTDTLEIDLETLEACIGKMAALASRSELEALSAVSGFSLAESQGFYKAQLVGVADKISSLATQVNGFHADSAVGMEEIRRIFAEADQSAPQQ